MSKSLAQKIVDDFVRIKIETGKAPSKASYPLTGKFTVAMVIDVFGAWTTAIKAAGPRLWDVDKPDPARKPKILIYDVETVPILGYVWQLFDQNVSLNMIKSDWHLLSAAAKWLDEPKIFYLDQRDAKNFEDDKPILEMLWKLMDEADIIVGQNSKAFDTKKINARFILNGMRPPSPYKQIDTRSMAKKNFSFTSNKLEYLSDKLTPEMKKSQHKNFPGFELWKECLARNPKAFKELKHYNEMDLLATEAIYKKMSPWGGTGVDINQYRGGSLFACQCGSSNYIKRGFKYTATGKFNQYSCNDCGSWFNEGSAERNLISDKKKKSLKGPV